MLLFSIGLIVGVVAGAIAAAVGLLLLAFDAGTERHHAR